MNKEKPKKTAKWIPVCIDAYDRALRRTYVFECSSCGRKVDLKKYTGFDEMDYKFCPYCGIPMREEA